MSSNSSSFRTEISIPVKKDPRTFEQSRKDLVTKLEKSYKTSSTADTSGVGDSVSSMSSQSLKSSTRSTGAGPLANSSSWEFQRNRWIDEAKRQFDDDVRRMRSNMFALEPVDDFDIDHWDNFGSADHGFEAMERRMQAMREQMDSQMRMLSAGGATMGLPSTGGHHQMTSHFSSSSVRTVNDGGVVKSNTTTTQESRQTVDGVTTGTKSHSSSSSTNKLGAGGISADRQLLTSSAPGAVIPTTPGSPGVMDFLSNAYEVGDDGLVHFKIRFDAKDFAPEDIDVTTVGNRLTVHASKSVKTTTSESNREFSRSVDLPRSIDHEKFSCSLTEDGVLVLDAPVKAPDYASITFDSSHNLGIRPKDSAALKAAETQVTSSMSALKITGQSGPVILNDGAGGRKIHLEVPIESDYSADDLCVRMEANQICVSGKKERSSDRSTSGSTSKSSEFSEFSRTFEVPETIDPFTVSAVLKDNTLVIEAPLLCTV